uniref:Uncharacterized protein n=1 Tax=Physcomitrium patens TaxID=3218 RepID=A0A2K1IBP9_PHYPA|nr:hypothetical protein PHYPA_030189 [Physcomitrium patens]
MSPALNICHHAIFKASFWTLLVIIRLVSLITIADDSSKNVLANSAGWFKLQSGGKSVQYPVPCPYFNRCCKSGIPVKFIREAGMS